MAASDELKKKEQVKNIIDLSIKLGVLFGLLFFSYMAFRPFLSMTFWAIIISVTIYPYYNKLVKLLKGRKTLAAVIITVLMLTILALPSEIFIQSLVQGIEKYSKDLKAENVEIPPPDVSVKSWPIIGEPVYNFWYNLSKDTFKSLEAFGPQLKAIGLKLLDVFMQFGLALLEFLGAIVISAFLLINSDALGKIATKFFTRLAGEKGEEFCKISEVTIRNVSNGVLGVAVVQSFLIGVILYFAGVPYVGLWTLICFVLAAVQIGPGPVIFGVIFYIFLTKTTFTAILWTIPLILVTFVDNIIRPILMGKGAKAPMLVIFIGSMGGLIYSGFIGMFTGAILFALMYKLFIAWVNDTSLAEEEKEILETNK